MLIMFDRITTDPAILAGKPVVKGTRISVEFILELAASGASSHEIVHRYPQLAAEDVKQAFLYAGKRLASEETISLAVAH